MKPNENIKNNTPAANIAAVLGGESGFRESDFGALLSALGQTAIVSITDAQGNITYANDTFVEVAKYSLEELIGQNHRILKSGHQPQEIFDDLWKTISAGGMWRGEIKNRAKDGSYYWVDTSIAPIIGAAGIPERYVAVRFLITEKKEAEERITRQNAAMLNVLEDLESEKTKFQKQVIETQKFALAVNASGEHIIITDPEGVILYANPAAERLTGYSRAEMIGTKAGALWGGRMSADFYRGMWHTVKTEKKIFQGEIENIRKSGEPYSAEMTISPVLGEKGEILFFIGTERDVTKAKEVDKAKTEFVSLASHQLRTPLSTINWYAEMLLAGDAGALNDQQKKFLQEIYAGNQRMVELVTALLNVSRLELGTFSVEPEFTDLAALMQSVLDEQMPDIRAKNIKMETRFSGDIPSISADRKLLRIVFQNLLSNAVKYSNADGAIVLSLSQSGGNIDFSVADSGWGIPKNQQGKIFTKLFRADNARQRDAEGTGLGLYIVKSIIEHSGGTIRFESEENKGTTFFVSFPAEGMKKKEGARRLD